MLTFPVSIVAVNELSAEAFVEAFGDVAEHSPWVAEGAAARRPFADRDAMAEAFIDTVLDAGEPKKLDLLLGHPDLAGRAAIAGDMAEDSKREQAGAGLDRLSPEEFARFTELNEAYRRRFCFPFILAVKGVTKEQILNSFAKRLRNDPEAEFHNAVRQVLKIITFRIEDRVAG